MKTSTGLYDYSKCDDESYVFEYNSNYLFT